MRDVPDFLLSYGLLTQSFLSQLVTSNEELKEIQKSEDKLSEDKALKEAVRFIEKAKESNGKIMICGDYDCDGITSTTMLHYLLEKIGFDKEESIGFYIPNRLKEGYGASKEVVEAAVKKGYTHFIFVDNGVKTVEANDYLVKHQIPLLIIDHHTIENPLDESIICLHPDVLDPYFEGLCGAGLVYILAKAMKHDDDFISILAAIGTIGDMMNLRKQNRAIVKKGLYYLNQKAPLVISSLLKRKPIVYDETLISFQIVPVFNAVGRLSDIANVNQVVKYLLLDNEAAIKQFSIEMIKLNDQRKTLSKEMGNLASNLMTEHPFQVIYDESFHEGLVGIIAGQIARATSKPTLVLTQNGNQIKGSARSQHFDVYSFLSQFNEYYTAFGGHQNACALSIPIEQFSQFRKHVNQVMSEVVLDEPSIDALNIPGEGFSVSNFDELMAFSPFGQGFEMMDVVLEVKVIKETPLNNSGVKWHIEPIGDLLEVVYFGSNHNLLMGIDQMKVVGKLQKFRNQLSLNATYIEQTIL